MPSSNDIVTQMIQALSVSEPTLDTSIGSPVRSILDVVAEPIAEAYADTYLLNYQYDVDAKSGSDLDSFVNVFGFSRYPAKRATGVVTFSRNTNTPTDIFLPAGTQVTTSATSPVVFSTVIPATMPIGTNSITVPVQAQVGGSSGNVAAATITTPGLGIAGISYITNTAATSGGTDGESDDQLRARFKATVFRQLTGTASMYEAVGLDDPDVTQANVIGASKVYTEQIQISGGVGTSSVQNIAYLFPNTSTFGIDIFGGNVFSYGTNYTLATGQLSAPSAPSSITDSTASGTLTPSTAYAYELAIVGPNNTTTTVSSSTSHTTSSSTLHNLTVNWTSVAGTTYAIYRQTGGSGAFLHIANVTASSTTASYVDNGSITPVGAPPPTNNTVTAPILTIVTGVPDGIYELSYEYLPAASRNVPASGITNRVDIYVNGTRAVESTQTTAFTTAFPFNTIPGDPYNTNNFQRDTGATPASGNFFIDFGLGPVLDPSVNPTEGQITVGSTTYYRNTDYWLCNNVTSWGLGPQSLSGIEWSSSNPPTNGTALSLDFDFNQIPQSVQKAVQNWRVVDTDVMVHQAKVVLLNFFFGVILAQGYTAAAINGQIYTALSNYVSGLAFDSVLQVSQVLSIVQGIGGIVACRLLTSTDNVLLVGNTNSGGVTNGDYSGTGTTTQSGFSAPAAFYGIQQVNTVNTVLQTYSGGVTPLRAVDVYLADDTVATVNQTFVAQMGQNLFGAV